VRPASACTAAVALAAALLACRPAQHKQQDKVVSAEATRVQPAATRQRLAEMKTQLDFLDRVRDAVSAGERRTGQAASPLQFPAPPRIEIAVARLAGGAPRTTAGRPSAGAVGAAFGLAVALAALVVGSRYRRKH